MSVLHIISDLRFCIGVVVKFQNQSPRTSKKVAFWSRNVTFLGFSDILATDAHLHPVATRRRTRMRTHRRPRTARRPAPARPPAPARYLAASGRMCGNSSTSRMLAWFVSSMTVRSMPMPMPPAGGMPYSSART